MTTEIQFPKMRRPGEIARLVWLGDALVEREMVFTATSTVFEDRGGERGSQYYSSGNFPVTRVVTTLLSTGELVEGEQTKRLLDLLQRAGGVANALLYGGSGRPTNSSKRRRISAEIVETLRKVSEGTKDASHLTGLMYEAGRA